MSKPAPKQTSSTAITNASLYQLTTNTFTTLNFAIKNNIIIATGYLPDDEKMHEINASNHVIINTSANLGPLLSGQQANPIPTQLAHITFTDCATFLSQLDTKSLTNQTKHICLQATFSELLYIIQEQSTLSTNHHYHIVLPNVSTDILNTLSATSLPPNISIGLLIDKTAKPYVQQLTHAIKSGYITSLSTTNYYNFLPTLTHIFESSIFEITTTLFTQHAHKTLNIKATGVTLLQKPNLALIQKKPPFSTLLTINQGEINHYG